MLMLFCASLSLGPTSSCSDGSRRQLEKEEMVWGPQTLGCSPKELVRLMGLVAGCSLEPLRGF